jgi:hypothetical protein
MPGRFQDCCVESAAGPTPRPSAGSRSATPRPRAAHNLEEMRRTRPYSVSLHVALNQDWLPYARMRQRTKPTSRVLATIQLIRLTDPGLRDTCARATVVPPTPQPVGHDYGECWEVSGEESRACQTTGRERWPGDINIQPRTLSADMEFSVRHVPGVMFMSTAEVEGSPDATGPLFWPVREPAEGRRVCPSARPTRSLLAGL